MDEVLFKFIVKDTAFVTKKWEIHLNANSMAIYKYGSQKPEVKLPRHEAISLIKFPIRGLATRANVIVDHEPHKFSFIFPAKQFSNFKNWVLNKSPEKSEPIKAISTTKKCAKCESSNIKYHDNSKKYSCSECGFVLGEISKNDNLVEETKATEEENKPSKILGHIIGLPVALIVVVIFMQITGAQHKAGGFLTLIGVCLWQAIAFAVNKNTGAN